MQAHRLIGAVLLLMAATACGQEQAVNVRTAGTQSNAAVTATARGFFVVWNSYYSSAGRSYDVLARRLDPNGEPFGAEFVVNPVTQGNQSEPAVAADGAGNGVVVWQGPGADEEDVFIRLYDPDGQPRSEVFLANEDPKGRQLRPRVACGGEGVFAVVWEERSTEGDKDVFRVCGRWFDPSGRPLGPSSCLDGGTGDARYPDVAMDGLGNATVVWLRDRTGKTVSARQFDANGLPRAEAFAVSPAPFSSATAPAIAMNRAGHFVIVWDGDANRASEDDVLGRCYDPDGEPGSEPFRVEALHEGAQQWPQVALNDANEFVVVWQQETLDPNTATDIFAQRFAGVGRPVGAPQQLNTYTAGHQRYPDLALLPDGRFVAVWESEGQDGSGYGIQACLVR